MQVKFSYVTVRQLVDPNRVRVEELAGVVPSEIKRRVITLVEWACEDDLRRKTPCVSIIRWDHITEAVSAARTYHGLIAAINLIEESNVTTTKLYATLMLACAGALAQEKQA